MKNTLFIICIFLTGCIYAKKQDVFFNSLKIEDGLSHHAVSCIYQDERGFIWIGTREGLNVYNGQNVTTYKAEENNMNSLLYNSIQKICGNQKGKIYIQGSQGVSALDLEKERFSTLVHDNASAITYHDKLYVAIDNKILYEENDTLKQYKTLKEKNDRINVLYFVDNDLWIGTKRNGIYIFSKDEIQNIRISGDVTDIYQDLNHTVWVSTGNGLYSFKNKVLRYVYKKDINSISSNIVRGCHDDGNGNLWIATAQGLDKLHVSSGKFTHYYSDEKPGSLNHSSITCISGDTQGNIWIGSYFGGVNYFNPNTQIYMFYKKSTNEGEGLSFPVVGKIIEDNTGNLWIATEGGGINYLDRSKEKFTWYKRQDNVNSLSENRVKSLYLDEHEQILWVGTHNGLNRFDLKAKKWKRFFHNPNDSCSIPSNIISDIIPYKDQLLVSTYGGVCLFNPQTGQSRQLFINGTEKEITYATDMYIDHNNILWIVTGEYLYAYDINTNALKKYFDEDKASSHNRHNVTLYIFEDSQHELWLATWGNGLYQFDKSNQRFKKFVSQKDGLLSDCIYGIIEFEPGKLLVSNNQGYSLIITSTKEIVNYSKTTGLPINGFNEYSIYKTKDNEIFLGSINGLLAFKHPKEQKQETAKIIPYRLLVNNKEVHAGDKTGILDKAICYTDKIVLRTNQNIFSLQFTTLDYTRPKAEIFYRLEGYSDKWINTNNFNSITYSDLPSGEYTLILASKDKITQKLSGQTRLEIKVLSPFYLSSTAIFIYAITVIMTVFYLLHSYNVKIRLRKIINDDKKLMKENEERTQFKINFFTKISHEFKTPLTLIIGEAEMLLKSSTQQASENCRRIMTIYKNSIQLEQLISELSDFKKQESQQLKISASPNNIVGFLYENYILFKPYAEKRNINFIFKKTVNELYVWYDVKYMQKVINNLLSNAFKYTKEHGTIKMTVCIVEDYVVFSVEDNGCGIRKEEQSKIFNYFYQTANISQEPESTGTGIGLALTRDIIESHHGKITLDSEPGKGSRFTIYLKLGNNQFTENEKKKNSDNFTEAHELQSIREFQKNDNLKYTMLIIEDNNDIRELLVNAFTYSYNLLTAINGKEGLQLAQKEIPDIIISDVTIPELSGIQLCKQLKNNYTTCHIPIVLLGTDSSIKYTIKNYQTGADDYILKPFNVSLLVARCNNLVNSRKALQERFSEERGSINIQSPSTNEINKNIFEKAMGIVKKHIADPEFNINAFANEMGMSRTNLFNKIKSITGETPNNMILNVRLKQSAILLIEHPEMSIGEIASKTGFSSIAYYSKCFKDLYNESPQVYRKNHQSYSTLEIL